MILTFISVCMILLALIHWEGLSTFEKLVTVHCKTANILRSVSVYFEPCYFSFLIVLLWSKILFENKQTKNLILSDNVKFV